MPVTLPPLPEGNTAICLVIPDSPAWREIYMGSLLILQQWWYYDVGNSEDAEDAVQRAMECLYITQQNYEGCIDMDCADVQDCIENTPAIQDIINNISNSGNPNEPQRSSIYSQDVFDESETCDYDQVYGYCLAFWNFINETNIDFLQIMAESSNKTEQISELISAIPIFGSLPIDEVLGWVDNFTTYNLEAYESSITVGLEDEIVCDLMCIAIANDCHITFDQIYEYMLERAGGFTALNLGATFAEMVIFMLSGTYPSDKIVFIWTLLQLGCAFIATKFVGALGIRPYIIQARAGIADDAWIELCGCVSSYTSDWLSGNGNPVTDGWVINYGDYVAAPEQIESEIVSTAKYFEIEFTFTDTTTITNIEWTGLLKSPTAPPAQSIIRIYDASNAIIQEVSNTWQDSSPTSRGQSWSGTQIVFADWRIVIASNQRSNSAGCSGIMQTLSVSGEGTSPFV